MIDIHPGVEELRTSVVPVTVKVSCSYSAGITGSQWGSEGLERTNLIATGVLVRTLTPERKKPMTDG